MRAYTSTLILCVTLGALAARGDDWPMLGHDPGRSGATADGKKELLAMLDGYRESAESWKELLLDLKQRGLKIEPKLAIGDGALGFWKALPQVFGSTRAQRCWVHKTANVLNQLPK